MPIVKRLKPTKRGVNFVLFASLIQNRMLKQRKIMRGKINKIAPSAPTLPFFVYDGQGAVGGHLANCLS